MESNRMLNRKYWNSIHLKLLKQINNSDWNEKEKKSKKEKLNRLFKKMLEKEMLNNEYISLAHEIKSYDFLKKYFGFCEDVKPNTKTIINTVLNKIKNST